MLGRLAGIWMTAISGRLGHLSYQVTHRRQPHRLPVQGLVGRWREPAALSRGGDEAARVVHQEGEQPGRIRLRLYKFGGYGIGDGSNVLVEFGMRQAR